MSAPHHILCQECLVELDLGECPFFGSVQECKRIYAQTRSDESVIASFRRVRSNPRLSSPSSGDVLVTRHLFATDGE